MKLKKPTYQDRVALLNEVTARPEVIAEWNRRNEGTNGRPVEIKTVAFDFLADSCGDSYSAVEKRFRAPDSTSYRDTPASVWRCWNLDFRGVDLCDL